MLSGPLSYVLCKNFISPLRGFGRVLAFQDGLRPEGKERALPVLKVCKAYGLFGTGFARRERNGLCPFGEYTRPTAFLVRALPVWRVCKAYGLFGTGFARRERNGLCPFGEYTRPTAFLVRALPVWRVCKAYGLFGTGFARSESMQGLRPWWYGLRPFGEYTRPTAFLVWAAPSGKVLTLRMPSPKQLSPEKYF